MVPFVAITDEAKNLSGSRNPYWVLRQAIGAFGRRDMAACEGWLARLRLGLNVPFTTTPETIEAGDFDQEDPYEILGQVIEAKGKGQVALAVALFDVLQAASFGCPSIRTEYEVIEAMEAAGFGRMKFVDTGLGLPE
jgi:hypothetical protein